ncbi:hypothetical protein [Nocardioides abyssi]|uniref:Uncharacterized protein n=1 Tax=Nocardioides abyssi TaxID=3058370 RepID=A0ABT8EWR7_9ACTN|nr:hypothetical protein [Nocardioides abyssi]MDN4162504.1 hypothetical protein [Nocardioides abyssi]
MTDDRLAALDADLVEAERDLAEHRRLTGRLGRAEAAVAAATQELGFRKGRLREETADVAKLESFSPTRIWAGLTGRRETDLDRERAEQQAAEYAVAEAEAARDRARAEVAQTQQALRAVADADVRRRRALTAKEDHLRAAGHPAGGELDELAATTGAGRSALGELQEAGAAADAALARLQAAADLLGSAQSWSTADTFLGGGMVTDLVKYDRMDGAQRLMREADVALKRLSTELADVGMSAVGGIEVTELARAFDVWFDNIFSDWSVRNRIAEAADRVARTSAAVARVREELRDRVVRQQVELDLLAARREELLGGSSSG